MGRRRAIQLNLPGLLMCLIVQAGLPLSSQARNLRSRERPAIYNAPTHKARLVRREIRAGMNGAPIIPYHHVAWAPFVGVDQRFILNIATDFLDNLIALVARQAFNARCEKRVYIERRLAIVGASDKVL